ncbi:hypothetical protein [Novosphingobium sp.]|uniref:hypothetical protein n=1 Tax=Novosphingobium sp. TaxID=1874826 RepID=UPI00273708EA|nr:hypothetical protein [Novosphingobium sp.]MDP3906487.1 hypothetical protein [Novosphingobium sp.]
MAHLHGTQMPHDGGKDAMNKLRGIHWLAALAGLAAITLPGRAAAQDGATPLGATATGQTTFGADVGRIEARLLTGVVVKQAASRIVDAIGTDFSSLTMVVLPIPKEAQDSASTVGGMGWDVLQSADRLPVFDDMIRVREGLTRFSQRYDAIAAAGAKACRVNVQGELTDKGVIDRLGSITSVLNAATPLLNLFKQDFVYQGLSTRVREGMLVTAVRGEIAARRKPPVRAAAGGPQNLREAVAATQRQLAALPAAATCGESDGGAETARIALAGEFGAFLGELSGPGSQPGTSLIGAAEDQLRRFGPRPATLVLAIDADGASLVKRSNLVTMFGAESTTVSSGIVVSYEFYEPQSGGIGALKAAGVLSCVSGAVGIRAMHNADKIRTRAICY